MRILPFLPRILNLLRQTIVFEGEEGREEGKGGIYLEKENIYLCQVEENLRKKMRKTFGEGIFFSSEEKKMETEKEKNSWRRKMS